MGIVKMGLVRMGIGVAGPLVFFWVVLYNLIDG